MLELLRALASRFAVKVVCNYIEASIWNSPPVCRVQFAIPTIPMNTSASCRIATW